MSFYRDSFEENERFVDSPEFEQFSDEISAKLFEMNGLLSTLQQFVKTLQNKYEQGSVNTKAVENINKKAVSYTNDISALTKSINELVHKVDAIEETSLDRSQLISREKLTRDVKYSVQVFQTVQSEFAKTTKLINNKAKSALVKEEQGLDEGLREELEDQHQQQQQQQQKSVVIEREPINNEEFAYQQNLIRERDQEISNIERGISELNGIFQDLGAIVQQQGHLVDNIETNIYSVGNNTQSAARELNKAMKSQRRSSKWCLYMLAVLSVFLLLMTLVVLT